LYTSALGNDLTSEEARSMKEMHSVSAPVSFKFFDHLPAGHRRLIPRSHPFDHDHRRSA